MASSLLQCVFTSSKSHMKDWNCTKVSLHVLLLINKIKFIWMKYWHYYTHCIQIRNTTRIHKVLHNKNSHTIYNTQHIYNQNTSLRLVQWQIIIESIISVFQFSNFTTCLANCKIGDFSSLLYRSHSTFWFFLSILYSTTYFFNSRSKPTVSLWIALYNKSIMSLFVGWCWM